MYFLRRSRSSGAKRLILLLLLFSLSYSVVQLLAWLSSVQHYAELSILLRICSKMEVLRDSWFQAVTVPKIILFLFSISLSLAKSVPICKQVLVVMDFYGLSFCFPGGIIWSRSTELMPQWEHKLGARWSRLRTHNLGCLFVLPTSVLWY